MALLLKQIMLERDMLLKKINYLNIIFFIIIFFLSIKIDANESITSVSIKYLNELKNFSSSFIQDDGITISEGYLYIGKNRVRVEYVTPTKILIILDKDKAMYYNYDLDEDEFFNPKNSSAWFFFDIFRNPSFFEDGFSYLESNSIILKKDGVYNDETYSLNLFFENNPLILKKIKFNYGDTKLNLSIFNHKYDQSFEDRFFKLINPSLLN